MESEGKSDKGQEGRRKEKKHRGQGAGYESYQSDTRRWAVVFVGDHVRQGFLYVSCSCRNFSAKRIPHTATSKGWGIWLRNFVVTFCVLLLSSQTKGIR